MPKLSKIGYSLKDVTIIPAEISEVKHRSDVDPYTIICDRKVLPVFVAPMATVTDETNYNVWIENKLTPVIPRTVQQRLSFVSRIKLSENTFVSVSLEEARILTVERALLGEGKKHYICVDVAQGAMESLLNVCKELKKIFGEKLEVMSGNIANPASYKNYCNYGIDWVRCSIGTGSRCTSACNNSTYMPLATLLDEINEIRKVYENEGKFCTKVIADGGIGWFDDIQKSLALGADAVMCGKLFNECDEACAPFYWSLNEHEFMKGVRIRKNAPKTHKKYREYYGMSTKIAQQITGKTDLRTSEGISRPTEVKYNVGGLVDNMESYLRSCMSYAGCFNLKEFRENTELVILGGCGDITYRK